jgi:hypothetical protein
MKTPRSFYPFVCLAAFVAGCLAPAARPPVVTPPAPATPHVLTVHLFDGDPAKDEKVVGARLTLGALDVQSDAAGNAWLEAPSLAGELCVAADHFARACQTLEDASSRDLNVSLTRTFVALPPLTTRGKIFLAGGEPWRWRGVSAFGLLNRFAKGEDIGPFLDDYRGYNILRVWPYVPWTENGWDSPSADVVVAFLKRVETAGFYVELTLLTDDNPSRLEPARQLIRALAAARPTNLVLEAGNEPTTHKAIDTHALRAELEASGFLYSSGDYEDSARFYGSFLTAHTARDGEWPRRAHDLLEYWDGGGPNAPSDPAHRVPIVADEPAKPADVGGNKHQDWRAYFGASSLLGAGATFHSETGKFGARPNDEERELAAVALEALQAFPADAPLGGYRRPVERSLRSYVVGERFMVRVRPATPDTPEPGFRAIDADGVLLVK